MSAAPLLALNVGSSTLKFTSFNVDSEAPTPRLSGLVDGIGQAKSRFVVKDLQGQVLCDEYFENATHRDAISKVLDFAKARSALPCAIVHRVVHGGSYFPSATLVTDEVRQQVADLTPLAPLHQPGALAGLDAARAMAPDVPQVICCDTAFHMTQDDLATRFGIDTRWHDAGVRRYSFHGLSYAAIAHQLPRVLGAEEANKNVVVLHLGSGSSACIMRERRSVANSTGMSACDGLMMSTRPGYLDPEVVLYWMEHGGMDIAAVRQELYKRSGLLGVSGFSADMRELLASDAPRAKLAVDLYCYRAAREVGALAAQAGGVDHVVFTGGIGERSAPVREKILSQLAWMGFKFNAEANQNNATCLTHAGERMAWRIATDEEGQMARETIALLGL